MPFFTILVTSPYPGFSNHCTTVYQCSISAVINRLDTVIKSAVSCNQLRVCPIELHVFTMDQDHWDAGTVL